MKKGRVEVHGFNVTLNCQQYLDFSVFKVTTSETNIQPLHAIKSWLAHDCKVDPGKLPQFKVT